MKYIGAKPKLLEWIFERINKHVAEIGLPENAVFLDACTGTASVATRAMKEGYSVVANDLLSFATHVARGRLCAPSSRAKDAKELVEQINIIPSCSGALLPRIQQSRWSFHHGKALFQPSERGEN